MAEIDTGAGLEAIEARKATLTPVREKALHIRPTSHWGLNE